jgi:hypothetical protein
VNCCVGKSLGIVNEAITSHCCRRAIEAALYDCSNLTCAANSTFAAGFVD